ncbi:hypothetical protein CBR_g20208 [Chara braunii]|uniref:Uncharacterized protein n=1 Tax=Chara braunii TaxID=69332 RepID=A0A388KZT9_CHABU|nr:hypothetical protein CBR_g20208 [Chara braunii]|eukprot:GBG75577.1 hypothetical protein CBR_g20208 [Chara braunii]
MDTIPLPAAKAAGLQIVIRYVHGHPFGWGTGSCWDDLIEAYCLASQYQINGLCERILLLVCRVAHPRELGDLLNAAIPRQAEEVLNAAVQVLNEVWAFESKSFLGWSKESITYCLENVTFYPNVTETVVAEAVLCATTSGTWSAGVVEPKTTESDIPSGNWCGGIQQNAAHIPSGGNRRAGIVEQGVGHIPTGNASQAGGIQPSTAAHNAIPYGYLQQWQAVIPFGYEHHEHHDAVFHGNTEAAPIPFGYGCDGIIQQNASHLPFGNRRAGFEQNTAAARFSFGNWRAGLKQNTGEAAAKEAEKPVVPRIVHACKKALRNCAAADGEESEDLVGCSLSR